MTTDDFFRWALPALLSALMLIIGYFVRKVIEDVDELKTDSQECALQHEKQKSHVAENYARKTDVQHSLDRIHTRLDQLPGEILRTLRKGE